MSARSSILTDNTLKTRIMIVFTFRVNDHGLIANLTFCFLGTKSSRDGQHGFTERERCSTNGARLFKPMGKTRGAQTSMNYRSAAIRHRGWRFG